MISPGWTALVGQLDAGLRGSLGGDAGDGQPLPALPHQGLGGVDLAGEAGHVRGRADGRDLAAVSAVGALPPLTGPLADVLVDAEREQLDQRALPVSPGWPAGTRRSRPGAAGPTG
jgi:hypothetical protein